MTTSSDRAADADLSMSVVDRLVVREACRELVLRAAACADSGDARGLADLFLADGVLQRPNAPPLQGREAICESYARRTPGRITRHLVTNTLVDIEAPDRARARSCVLLWAGSEADAPGAQGRLAAGPQVVGEFDDHLSLTPHGWRIARRDARFLFHTP